MSDFDDDDDVGLHVLGCRVDNLILKTSRTSVDWHWAMHGALMLRMSR